MTEETYHQISRETILNRSKTYYNENNDILKERSRNKCREVSEEEKNIKTEYGGNRYHNMFHKKTKNGRNIYHNMSDKKSKDWENTKKIIVRLRSLNLVIKILR